MRTRANALRIATAFSALLLGGTTTAIAQARPPLASWEVPGQDFRPNGVWRVKARRVARARRAALETTAPQPWIVPNRVTVEGTLHLPVVLIAYSDTTVGPGTPVIGDTALYHALFFSANPMADMGHPYSLRTYYEEQSHGRFTIDGRIFGWINTPFPYASVGNHCCVDSAAVLFAMFRAALDSLNSPQRQVDWGQFDNDGPDGVPNSGDDDGYVDLLSFVHPTIDKYCLGENGDRIQTHRGYLSGNVNNTNPYATKTPRTGGGVILIDDYTVVSGRGGATFCDPTQILAPGVLAHETGHGFGLPDLYAVPPDPGVGDWSLMATGCYTTLYSPSALDGWSRAQLGWATIRSLTATQTVSLGPVQTGDTVLVAQMAGSDEYLVLENRAALGSDRGMMTGTYMMPGLVMFHVNQSGLDSGIVNHPPPGRVESIRLVQSDGGEDAGPGASFPGLTENHRVGPYTVPAARTIAGTSAGFVIDSIVQHSPTGRVDFHFTLLPPVVPVTLQQVTDAILHLSVLTSAQAAYLDAIGDHNGTFDLPDYLAYMRANGLAPLQVARPNPLPKGP